MYPRGTCLCSFYAWLRISIRGRVRPSVGLSVCPVLFSKDGKRCWNLSDYIINNDTSYDEWWWSSRIWCTPAVLSLFYLFSFTYLLTVFIAVFGEFTFGAGFELSWIGGLEAVMTRSHHVAHVQNVGKRGRRHHQLTRWHLNEYAFMFTVYAWHICSGVCVCMCVCVCVCVCVWIRYWLINLRNCCVIFFLNGCNQEIQRFFELCFFFLGGGSPNINKGKTNAIPCP